ncbi:MAG: NAD-dependent epimerase/dehydratase family protein, partial [Thermoguttaceae bacterium]
LLDRGERVRTLVRSPSRAGHLEWLGAELAEGSLSDLDSLRRAARGTSVVYHVAGITKAFTAREYYDVNCRGVAHVARICGEQESPPVLVVVSSLAAAGPASDGRPHEEGDESRPVSLYGHSKRAGEKAAERYASQVPITVVRPPIVFGEGDKGCLEMFKTVARSGVHPVPGYLPKAYSIIHADDLVEALILAACGGKRLPGERVETVPDGTGYYFAACDENPTYYKLGRLIGSALGRRHTLTIPFATPVVRAVGAFGELRGRVRGEQSVMNWDKAREATAGSWTCSSQKARRELGFTVPCSLADRLHQTAQWYRNAGWL